MNVNGNHSMSLEFHYSVKDLKESDASWIGVNWGRNQKKSKFDEILTSKWDKAVENGIFKYKLDDCKYKTLTSSKSNPMYCVAQLNPQRSFNRRKRETFSSMNEKFTQDQFNFTKICDDEILFTMVPPIGSAATELQKTASRNVVVVNISPIDYGHVLLIPALDECQSQRLTAPSLLLAFDFLQLSSNPGFRVGFNSLHAWASINHLHFHGMYLQHQLFMDNIPTSDHVAGSCYLIDGSSPMPAFVFNVPKQKEDRVLVAKDIEKLVNILHEGETPYNMMLTRGSVGTRCVIVPRKSTKNLEPSESFDVACVEIGGQFPIKYEKEFCSVTHDSAFKILAKNAVSNEVFDDLVQKMKQTI
ncbi:GDP-D-glucose phosphorylase 1 [Ciona intestinalis]